MIKKLFIYLSVILLIASCYKFDKPDKPKNLISKEQMVNILIDIRLLASANGSNKIILENNKIHKNTYVYKKYQIDSLQFALSNNYYAYYLDEFEAIYAKVKDSLDILKNKFDALAKQEEKEKKFRDSIQGIVKKNSIRILQLKGYINLLVKKDSLKSLIKKDSIRLITMKDSLNILIKKDSINRFQLKTPIKEGLITPVSDIDFQQ